MFTKQKEYMNPSTKGPCHKKDQSEQGQFILLWMSKDTSAVDTE